MEQVLEMILSKLFVKCFNKVYVNMTINKDYFYHVTFRFHRPVPRHVFHRFLACGIADYKD